MHAVLEDAGFEAALLTAALLAFVVVVMARGSGELRGAPAVAVLASLVGLSVIEELDALLVVGLVVLAAGAWSTRRKPFVLRCAAATPGAVLVALSLPGPAPTWAALVALAAIPLLGPAWEAFDARSPRATVLLLLVVTVGIYVCVPETDAVRPLLGAFGVAAVLAGFPRLGALPGAASAAAALLVWGAAGGGYVRPGSVVGGIACISVVVLAWTSVGARGARCWFVGAVLVGLIAFCARVAGFEDSAWEAAALSALGFVAASAAIYATSR